MRNAKDKLRAMEDSSSISDIHLVGIAVRESRENGSKETVR